MKAPPHLRNHPPPPPREVAPCGNISLGKSFHPVQTITFKVSRVFLRGYKFGTLRKNSPVFFFRISDFRCLAPAPPLNRRCRP